MAETLTVTIDSGTYAVSVTGVSLFSDSALTTSVTFPQSVSADTTWYAAPAARGGRRQILVRATAPNGDNIQVDVLQSLPATVDLGEGAVDYSGPSSPGGSSAVSVTTVAAAGASQVLTFPDHGAAVYDLTGSAASCALTFTGGTADEECSLTLYLRAGSGHAWTWPTNVQWAGRSDPSLSATDDLYDIVVLTTTDACATINGPAPIVGLQAKAEPAQVTGLETTPGFTQNGLDWAAATPNGTPVTNYKIYRTAANGASGSETLLATVGNVLTYSDTGLTNGAVYRYKVSAVNAVGEGTQSAEVSGTPTAVVVSDAFTRTSASSPGTADTGQAWTAATGTWGTDGAKAYSVTGADGDQMWLDSGVTDQTIQVAVEGLTTALGAAALGRWGSTSTFYFCGADAKFNHLDLQKQVSGSWTLLGQVAYTPADGDIVELKCIGSTISGRVIRSGSTLVSVGPVTDTSIASGTKVGLRTGYASNSPARFDNFTVAA